VNGGLLGFYLVITILEVVAGWIIFQKAGQEGWKILIPIYNIIIFLRIVDRPWWWLLLLLIPIVNIVLAIMVLNDLSKSFGHGAGFTVGLVLLRTIFVCILAFGSSRYIGPRGVPTTPAAGPGEEVAAW
jgi:hypothetical protein